MLFASSPLAGIEEMRKSWGWILSLGILLVILGTVCVIGNVSATFASVLVFGWLLMLSSVLGVVHGFRAHRWKGSRLPLLTALLRGIVGFLMILFPLAGAATLTLILACLLVVGGLFRAIGSGMLKFPRWGWSMFSGILSLALGIMLLAQMPVSSLWFLGFAVGLDLIFDGAALINSAAALHSLPDLALGKTA